ncbi:HAD-IIB family hydrolase [Microterricola pindariensis]|uniref:phosphomannomutase n=1 Tax=Microterricola pindariensis TaxID=478010 RepID=A0ABX5AX20_9MICO|nr:HAD-IIB family hydrolase [Microterricola pindariensis]PPL19390.1 HAD family hydrolase [Microterricola pindariensis]
MTTQLVAFDLDDTLAASKSPMDPEMATVLLRLLEVAEVCIISGGNYAQFQNQVLRVLDIDDEQLLARLHLMPTCGTQYLRFEQGAWAQRYAEVLSDDQKARALESVERNAQALGYWESDTWGPILEDRGSQITFSALGQQAPVEAKAAWDADGVKKGALRDAVALELLDLEVRSGGSTSIDITKRGVDKAYGMNKLVEATGIPLENMLFIGDRLDEGGNDYPVKAMGVRCIAVHGWQDTVGVVTDLLEQRFAA